MAAHSKLAEPLHPSSSPLLSCVSCSLQPERGLEMVPLGSGSAGCGPGGPAPSKSLVPAVSSPREVLKAVVSCLAAQVLGRVSGISIPEGDHRTPNKGSAPAPSGAPFFSLAAARGSLERERGFSAHWLTGKSAVNGNAPQHVSDPTYITQGRL